MQEKRGQTGAAREKRQGDVRADPGRIALGDAERRGAHFLTTTAVARSSL